MTEICEISYHLIHTCQKATVDPIVTKFRHKFQNLLVLILLNSAFQQKQKQHPAKKEAEIPSDEGSKAASIERELTPQASEDAGTKATAGMCCQVMCPFMEFMIVLDYNEQSIFVLHKSEMYLTHTISWYPESHL